MTKKKWGICFILGFFFILYVIIGFRAPISSESKTISYIFCLEKDMNIALTKNNSRHPVTVADVIEMYQKDKKNILYKITVDGQSIKDGWDMPIVVEFTEPSIYKFISYGPNKKDDQCEGDDIYAVYDLSDDNYKLIEQKGLLFCSEEKQENNISTKIDKDDLWYKQQIERDIEKGIDLNLPLPDEPSKYTHLHEAALGDYIESAKLFVKTGGDVDPRDHMEATPLHRAIQNGSLKVARLLIDNGADINAKDDNGKTPLFWAVQSEHDTCQIISFLIESGADYKIVDKHQRTPLFSSCYLGNMEAMNMFLNLGMDINQKDEKNYTPLHIAAWYGHYKIVKMLLEKGVDVNIVADGERTPLDCALISLDSHHASPRGKRKCVSLLKEFGGKRAVELTKP